MPIFPRYGGVSTNIAYDKAVEAPSDPRPRQIQQLGAGIEQASGAFLHASQKRQALEDEAEAQKRYMQAVTDMESMTETLNVPDNAKQGKALFGKFLTEREGEWFKGLNGNQQGLLKKRLFSKQLEYQVGAAKLENRAKLEDYSATMVNAQTVFAQKASRRIGPDDASETSEYADFTRMVDVGVASGYLSASKGEEMKDGALKQGAYTRVYQATASDSQVEVQNVLDLYKKERESEGATFLKHIEPEKRVALEKQLKERLGSLRHAEQTKVKQEKQDTKEMQAELSKATTTMAAQKLNSPEKYGALTTDWIDLAADLQLMDDKDVILFRRELETRASSGTVAGYNDPIAFQRYAVEAYDTRSPEQAAKVRDELKADMARGKITSTQGSVWLNHLEEKAKPAGGNAAVSKASNDVRDVLKTKLRTTGAMQATKGIENSVLGEALEKLGKNEVSPNPENPWAIFDREINGWQARVGVPAAIRANEIRRSVGLSTDRKTAAETLEQQRTMLQKQFKAAPPGPEGDALRSALRDAAKRLMELQRLEKSMTEQRDAAEQSRSQRQQQQSGSGAPVVGPRR